VTRVRFFVFLWVVLEVLQVAVIAALAVGYRNLQRRVNENYSFTERQPRSITDDKR
jgi:hypothetical protein